MKMPNYMKKASQADWLGKSRIVEVASTTFPAFRFSPLAACVNRLTIDVDDAQIIAPLPLAQPPFFGRDSPIDPFCKTGLR